MPTTWTIAIDWDRNGNYTDTYDDVTSRVTQVNWFLGMRKPYQETADNSALALVLTNADRRFSPECGTLLADGLTPNPLFGKVVPFKPIRIQSNDGSTTRTHWVGWIEAIQPAVNKYGERLTKIVASGVMQFYKATETNIALQENKRTDEFWGINPGE